MAVVLVFLGIKYKSYFLLSNAKHWVLLCQSYFFLTFFVFFLFRRAKITFFCLLLIFFTKISDCRLFFVGFAYPFLFVGYNSIRPRANPN